MSRQVVSKAQPVHTVDDGDDDGPYRMQCSLLQGLMHRPARVLASNQTYDLGALSFYLWGRLAAGKELLDPNTRIPISAESVLKGEHVQELPDLKAEIDHYCATHNRPLPAPYQCDITVLGDMICGKNASVGRIGSDLLATRVQAGLSQSEASAVFDHLRGMQRYSGNPALSLDALFLVTTSHILLGGAVPKCPLASIHDVATCLASMHMVPQLVWHLRHAQTTTLQLAAAEVTAVLAAMCPQVLLCAQALPALMQLLGQPLPGKLQSAVVRAVDSLAWVQPPAQGHEVTKAVQQHVSALLTSQVDADQLSAVRILEALSIDSETGVIRQHVVGSLSVIKGLVQPLAQRTSSMVQRAAARLLRQLAGSDSTHASIISSGFLQVFYHLESAPGDVVCGAAEVLQAVVHQGMKPAVALVLCKQYPALQALAADGRAPGCVAVAEYVRRVMEQAYSGRSRSTQGPVPPCPPQRQYPSYCPVAPQYLQPHPPALHPTYYAPQYMHTYGMPRQ